jgi:hypothetical protein
MHEDSNARRIGTKPRGERSHRQSERQPRFKRGQQRSSGLGFGRSLGTGQERRGQSSRRRLSRHLWRQLRQRQIDNPNQRRCTGTGVTGQVLGRRDGTVFMHTVVVVIIVAIVMVSFAFEVHHRVLVLASVRHHHGNASMGQRLPAHAEHQDEGGQATAHGRSLPGWTCTRHLPRRLNDGSTAESCSQ